jgi:hypothetical protein
MASRSIPLEDALSALDRRCGETVVATLEVVLDQGTSRVMAAVGELSHWHSARSAWAWSGEPSDGIRGMYSVGTATIDVTQLRPTSVLEHEGTGYGLMFDLDDQVILTIAWNPQRN